MEMLLQAPFIFYGSMLKVFLDWGKTNLEEQSGEFYILDRNGDRDVNVVHSLPDPILGLFTH